MQLTRAADYAVRVMIHLASQPEGTVISKSILAKASEAPESFLSKILQSLARAGLIQARRGVVGGFQLLDRGAQSSLLDVVESIDGPIALNICLGVGVACHRQPDCAAHAVWLRAQTAMLSVLREAKIADMASARNACGPLLHIASAGEPKQLSRQSGLPKKSISTARRRSAPKGSPRVSGKKHNKIN
jgi:Rrf2 family protein